MQYGSGAVHNWCFQTGPTRGDVIKGIQTRVAKCTLAAVRHTISASRLVPRGSGANNPSRLGRECVENYNSRRRLGRESLKNLGMGCHPTPVGASIAGGAGIQPIQPP